jgi:hypothetical protein
VRAGFDDDDLRVPELPWTDCPALIITEPTVPSIGLRNWA